MTSKLNLNRRAYELISQCIDAAAELRIEAHTSHHGVTVADFGINVAGGLQAGLQLARICMAGLATVELNAAAGDIQLPQVFVHTDHPLAACLQSQYAGWKIATDDFFAMGSGPMRAIAAGEELFNEFPAAEDGSCAVGVMEAGSLPTDSAVTLLREQLPDSTATAIAVAPTASQAGNVQVVARSVETAMHKLHELGFPIEAVVSGSGTAPLPPVAKDDLAGIGRTNDAILYGSSVNLWVDCEDTVIETFGPQTPSCASDAHGELFLNLFKAANHDFYALDKALFSPAVVVFHSLRTGHSFEYGRMAESLLHQSFGL